MNDVISDDELLFRGVIEKFWDYEKNRPSSAIFKDSKGVSVDRSYDRTEAECLHFLKNKRDFFKVCSIKTADVRKNQAVALYKKLPDNIYHSEIHDSLEKIEIRGSKAKKLRDCIFQSYP